MRKRISITVLFFIFFCVNASAFQFEDYKWGKTMGDIEDQVKNKGKNIAYHLEEPPGFVYIDEIYGKPCEVYCFFTPQDKLLSTVIVKWDDISIGSKVKQILSEKHWPPNQKNKFIEKYNWFSSDSDSGLILLDYSLSGTELCYLSEYSKEYRTYLQKQ